MRIKLLVLLMVMAQVMPASAQIDSVSKLSTLSLEELLNVKVITASGYLQKTSEAPSTIRYISAPLLKLVNVMKQIRESNDYSRHVEVNGKDEISILSHEFNNLMDEVAKSHQKKDEFIGISSHELQTPLTSVKLYLEALAKMKHEPSAFTFILKAKEGVKKLHNLILDLLDVSKIESGQLQLNHRALDIDELVDECIQDAQMNIASHTIRR